MNAVGVQAVVTCNCETRDAPLARSYQMFVQDCTGPGAPVVIVLSLGASILGIPEGSDTRQRFQVSVLRDLSTILKVSQTRIELLSLDGGTSSGGLETIELKFKVLHSDNPPSLSAVRTSMQQLVSIPFQVAGLPIEQPGGVRIISGPVERTIRTPITSLDQEQTLAQLQQAQMAEIDALHEAAANSVEWHPKLQVASLAVLMLLAT